MFESITKLVKKIFKQEKKENASSKETAKERLHLVLVQDRANVSADFLDLMKQEIIEVIKKYIEVDENEIDVKLTNKSNEDGTTGAPALYANIPILNIKEETKRLDKELNLSKNQVSNKDTQKQINNKNSKKKNDDKQFKKNVKIQESKQGIKEQKNNKDAKTNTKVKQNNQNSNKKKRSKKINNKVSISDSNSKSENKNDKSIKCQENKSKDLDSKGNNEKINDNTKNKRTNDSKK